MWSLITSDADLAATCERWSAAGVIGVDTEFVRERTYYPRPGLIQVADGNGVVMVDPLGISDFRPLGSLLADPAVVKLMHACDEDLEVLELLTGVTPRSVFDTQLAGAFAGHGFSRGYGSLVDVLLGVVLDAGETRSDWLRHPLSPLQLRYAALDVVYLLPIHERLAREMATLGRTAWFDEELTHRRRARTVDKQPEAAYVRIRRREALPPAHHAVLRALSRWREVEAVALRWVR
jgi:ribonuclease D